MVTLREPRPRTSGPVAGNAGLENEGQRLLFVTPRYAPSVSGVEPHVEVVIQIEQVYRELRGIAIDNKSYGASISDGETI
jgi:hypothetical protein